MSKEVFTLEAVLKLNDQAFKDGVESAKQSAGGFKDHLLANLAADAISKGLETIASGFMKIANVITNHVAPAVSRLDTLNSYGKTMSALGFSTDEATEAQSKLSDAIDGLPTTLDGIISWQQQFTALTDDIAGATDLTIALNNATLAAGKGQEAANNAMANWYGIIAAGAPDAQHWQSLYSMMPAQMNQLAESILGAGAKSDDLFLAWKEGTVTTDMVTSALIRFNNAGEQVGNTAAMMAMKQAGINEGVSSFADQAQIGAETIQTAYGNIDTAISRNVANVLKVLNGDASDGGGRIVQLLLSIKTLINNVGSTITSFVQAHQPEIDAIMSALNAIFKGEDLAGNIGTVLSNVGSILTTLFTNIKTFFEENQEAITETVSAVFGSVVQTLVELLPVLVPIALAAISAICTTLIENLPLIIESAVQIILALVAGLRDNLPTLIPAIVDAVILILNTVIDNLPFILEAALDIIVALALGLIDALPKLADAVPKIIAKIVAVLILHLPDIISAAVEIIMALCMGLIGALPDLIGAGNTIVQTLLEEFIKGFGDMKERSGQWGRDLISNFISGIQSMWSNFTGAIGEFVGYIANNIGFSEPKEGPLSNFHTYAPDMIDLFTTGIYDNEDKLKDAFNDVFQLPEMDTVDVKANGVTRDVAGYAAQASKIELTATIPIYFGGKKVGQEIETVTAYNNLISGGR
jgi:tape measure domain-containing protein